MFKQSIWKDAAELIGITAIVASLIFVGLQLRQEQQIAIADTFSSPTQSAGTLAELVNQYPEVWRRGLDGGELSPEDELRFKTIVEAVETHLMNMFIRFYWLEITDPMTIAQDYAYAIYVHPGLRQAYESSKSYQKSKDAAIGVEDGAGLFVSSVDAVLAALDRSTQGNQQTKEYVFW